MLRSETVNDSVFVGRKAICGHLEISLSRMSKLLGKLNCVVHRSLSEMPAKNQFCIALNRRVRPRIADSWIANIFLVCGFLLHPDKRPDLITLHVRNLQTFDALVCELLTILSGDE